ncbi:DUF4178 domain-containing protein [Noviherbaspirillum galbum]|uniref:DUF4178 domain-containing protein n=1 Tax=Noviherbaspirillum galbum TaxID=2709383 RepID=A0A6B3SW44_9BURK|nr:DUF4178 domain-containing protein [Noviherbaspirillum galbum]NEX61869.1 DUF4178 domain-containing protein [Noviherbaspirillum galbum]
MQTVSCPNCGAQVSFRSAASVMAVCEYCQSTLLKDADSVRNIGKVAEALEDYSPIQITTSGSYENRAFSVVGRIQLRYDAGYWNEWYVLFDDGSDGWLSDASGQYVMTVPAQDPSPPAFDSLHPGQAHQHGGDTWFVSDIRTARCISWNGELPFRVGRGWEAKVADLRCGHRFLTLDYSDGDVPAAYLGKAVTLEGLRCQLLRDKDAIAQSAGHFRGQTAALDCPSCGSGIAYKAGMAFHVVCPACHAEVDCSTDKALVLKKAEELERVTTTLALGDKGRIDGQDYDLIGLLQCDSGEEGDPGWTEYLLHHPERGFLWLVESDQGWDRVDVLNEWPAARGDSEVAVDGVTYRRGERYDSIVRYAAGAFNWRVSVDDRTHLREFTSGERKVTAESNPNEVVWTKSARIPARQVGEWFKKKDLAATPEPAASVPGPRLGFRPAFLFSLLLLLLNLPISIGSGSRGLRLILIAALLLWIPVFVIRHFTKERE